MRIDLADEPITALADYARVSAAFTVDRVMDVTADADVLGRFGLLERRLTAPYVKDYDAIKGEGPLQWAHRFDLSNWALFSARIADRRIGWAAVAFNVPELSLLEDRGDLAVLWDLRVSPDARGKGVGSKLFERSVTWARSHSCRQLQVETQNINVSACRFYARHGCELRAVNDRAYPNLPGEVQLLWCKDLLVTG